MGEAGDGEKTIRLVRELKPAILLLDLSMPCMGLEALANLSMSVRTIVLAAEAEHPSCWTLLARLFLRGYKPANRQSQSLPDLHWIRQVRQFGARAVILLSSLPDVLFECIRRVNGSVEEP